MTAESKSEEYIKLRVVGQDNSTRRILVDVHPSSPRVFDRRSPFQSQNDDDNGKIEEILRRTAR